MVSVEPPEDLLDRCRSKAEQYSEREVEFLKSIAAVLQVRAPLTDAQAKWLRDLADRERVDFAAINSAALAVLTALCQRWIPGGSVRGKEYVGRNPTRSDGSAGSFSVNVHNGKWGDFATRDKGGDPVSLAAYLFHSNDQIAAARDLKKMLGV